MLCQHQKIHSNWKHIKIVEGVKDPAWDSCSNICWHLEQLLVSETFPDWNVQNRSRVYCWAKLRNVHELHQVFGVRNAVLPQHRHDCHCLGTIRIKSQKKLQETKNRKPVPLRLWRYASYPEKLSLLIYHQRDSEVIRKRGYTGEHSNESQNNEITGVYSYLLYRSW